MAALALACGAVAGADDLAQLELERVVDLGQVLGRELDVDDWADDLGDAARRACAACCGALVRSKSWVEFPSGCDYRLCGRHRFGGRGDLGHFAGDIRLANLVVGQRQAVDEVVGIVGRVAHGHHLGAEERGGCFEDRLVNQHLDVARQKLFEDALRVGLEDVVEPALCALLARSSWRGSIGSSWTTSGRWLRVEMKRG